MSGLLLDSTDIDFCKAPWFTPTLNDIRILSLKFSDKIPSRSRLMSQERDTNQGSKFQLHPTVNDSESTRKA
ncbi:hypothetical protein E5288_WYG014805 [Bos mutus]|uniref:Uncharacterized protein n=1 Tax=Bos mutus TaxID=72004 RepID=A0A6B0RZ34_9CETA|nr:hypothetical protein [Bos mutus]